MVKFLSPWCSSWPQLPSRYSFHEVLAAWPLKGAGNQDLKVTKCTHPAVPAAWLLHSSHAGSGSPPTLEKLTCVMTMKCPRSTSSLKVLRWCSCSLYISSHRALTLLFRCPYRSETQRKAWKALATQAVNYSVRIPTTPFIFSFSLELFKNMKCFSTYLSRVKELW